MLATAGADPSLFDPAIPVILHTGKAPAERSIALIYSYVKSKEPRSACYETRYLYFGLSCNFEALCAC